MPCNDTVESACASQAHASKDYIHVDMAKFTLIPGVVVTSSNADARYCLIRNEEHVSRTYAIDVYHLCTFYASAFIITST